MKEKIGKTLMYLSRASAMLQAVEVLAGQNNEAASELFYTAEDDLVSALNIVRQMEFEEDQTEGTLER